MIDFKKLFYFFISLNFIFFNFLYGDSKQVEISDFNYIADESGKVHMSINVLGHVKMPGTYIINQNGNFFDILAASGGIMDGANINNVYLYRQNNEKIKINFKQYLKTGTDLNIEFQPNDTIYIQKSLFASFISNTHVLNLIISIMNLYLLFDRV